MDRNLRIRVLLEAGDKLTRPLREVAAGSSRAAKALAATRDRLKEIDKAQADVAGFRKLKVGLRSTEAELNTAKARVAELAHQMAAAASPTKKLTNEFAKAKREAAALGERQRQESVELQRFRERLRAAGVSTRELSGAERRLREDAARTTSELHDQERRLVTLTDRQKRFAEARERFGRVQGTATGLAAGGAAALATGTTIARPIAGSLKDAAEYESVMTDIAQKANLSREQARKMGIGLLAAARAANQLPEDLQKGVDTLAGFGLTPQQGVAMIAPIGRAATAYKAEIDDLARASFAATDNLKVPIKQTSRVLDIMAQAGKDGAFEVKDMAAHFPELTASLQSLGSKGTPAVADLAAALQITRKGAGDSAAAANNLQNLLAKATSGDTIKNFKKFGIDIPKALKKAVADGRSPIEELVELTRKATGGDQAKLSSLFGDMQVQQALRPLLTNMVEYRKIRSQALAANGVVEKDFGDRLNDTAAKGKRLQVQTKSLSVVLGSQLRPMVNGVADRFSAMGDRLSAWIDKHPVATRNAVVLAAAFAGIFLLLGSGAIVVAGMMAPFAALSGVAALLGTTSAGLLLTFARALLSPLRILPLLGRGVMLLATGIVRAGMLMLANPMIAGIALLVTAIGVAAFLIWKHWDRIKMAFAAGLAFLGGLVGRFRTFGSQIIQGLVNGITGRLSAVKGAVVGAAQATIGWFKQKLGIHSPSRVFAGLGGFLMAGLEQGIAAGAGKPVARIDALARRLAGSLRMTPSIEVGDAAVPVARRLAAAGTAGNPAAPLVQRLAGTGRDKADPAAPITSRVASMSREIGRALAIGSAAPALAAMPASGNTAAPPPQQAPIGPISITIQQLPGQSGEDLARLVRLQLEKMQRQQAVAGRSSYLDDPDHGGYV